MIDRIAQLQRMLEAEPGDVFCMYGLALEFAKRKDAAAAVEWFDRTLAADPHYCYAYFHKAKTLAEAGDESAAIATLRAGLARARASGDMHAASEIEGFLDELDS